MTVFKRNFAEHTDFIGIEHSRLEVLDGIVVGNNPVNFIDPLGLFDIRASTRRGIDKFGGEEMLGNFQKLSAVAAAATIESGPPALVFGGMAVVAGGLKSSLYSEHPYRDTAQSAVTMPFGSNNPGADFIFDEFINKTNELEDKCQQ